MPRLGHKKSRTGCRQCKARHVKCDESKPCSNCARHGVLCSLVDPNAVPTIPASTVASSSSSSGAFKKPTRPKTEPQSETEHLSAIPPKDVDQSNAGGPSDEVSSKSGSDHFPFITNFVNRVQVKQVDLWIYDLEAMHHWMTDGVDSLNLPPHNTHVWKTVVSKEGLKYTFLLHQILAMSSFHLANINPDRRADFYSVGIQHQDNALRGMRKLLDNITEDNAPALFATSTLVPISVFASRGLDAIEQSAESHNPLDDLADIFSLVHGIGRVLAAAQMGIIMSGPFQHLFRDPVHETAPQPLFQKMLEHLPTLNALFDQDESLDEDTRRDLMGFVMAMRENLLRCSRPCMENRDIRFLFYWPLHLSPNFGFELRQRSPGALVITMHYAMILASAAKVFWFLNGWTERIVHAIKEQVTEEPWKNALQWPLQHIEALQMAPPSTVPPPLEGLEI